jgi:hypothetical protein
MEQASRGAQATTHAAAEKGCHRCIDLFLEGIDATL